MVTLPDSDSEVIRSRSDIFSVLSWSSFQSNQLDVSSINCERHSRINVAFDFLEASATPIIDAAVTPDPPPLTIQMASGFSEVL